MEEKADARKRGKTNGNEKKGPGRLLSGLLVLTLVLSVLAASLPMLSAQWPPGEPAVTTIDVTASPVSILPEQVSTITATVTWVNKSTGDGFTILFQVLEPTLGAAVTPSSKTNANGVATATLAAGTQEGTVTVKASWIGDSSISDTTTVVIAAAPDVEPPVISNVASSGITQTTATITWTTNEVADSLVKYGTTSGAYTLQQYNAADVTSHSVGLTGLAANTTYYYVVNSTDPSNNAAQSTEYSFKTLPVPDTTPPVISGVTSSSVTQTAATITWTTNEVADSLVKYGTAPGVYTLQQYNAADVTSHSVGLTGLAANTTYYYVVNSTDPSGNSAQSGELSFKTLETGVIPRWDINEDGEVDDLDLGLLLLHYGETTSSPYPRWDINEDGEVDDLDLGILLLHYGEKTV